MAVKGLVADNGEDPSVRHLSRILLNALTAVSLLSFIPAVVVWPLSYFGSAAMWFEMAWVATPTRGTCDVEVSVGSVYVYYDRSAIEPVPDWQVEAYASDRARRRDRVILVRPVEWEERTPSAMIRSLWRFERVRASTVRPTLPGAMAGLTVGRHAIVMPIWCFVLASAVAPANRFRRWHRKRKRRDAGLCPECGYDLRATPDLCPECGTAPEAHV